MRGSYFVVVIVSFLGCNDARVAPADPASPADASTDALGELDARDATAKDSVADAVFEQTHPKDAVPDREGDVVDANPPDHVVEDVDESQVDREFAQWPIAGDSLPQDNYELRSDVAMDRITGLMWQRGLSDSMADWEDAASYCAKLVLDGHNDWRLPTRIELVSTIHYALEDRLVDETIFRVALDRGEGAGCWSITTTEGNLVSNAWVLHPVTGLSSVPQSATRSARCVRAGAVGPTTPYMTSENVVTDTRTRLEWQQLGASRSDFEASDAACAKLTLGGKSDWRLPTVRELESLFDPSTNDCAPVFQGCGESWSQSVPATSPTRRFVLDFFSGLEATRPVSYLAESRCVRGGARN